MNKLDPLSDRRFMPVWTPRQVAQPPAPAGVPPILVLLVNVMLDVALRCRLIKIEPPPIVFALTVAFTVACGVRAALAASDSDRIASSLVLVIVLLLYRAFIVPRPDASQRPPIPTLLKVLFLIVSSKVRAAALSTPF